MDFVAELVLPRARTTVPQARTLLERILTDNRVTSQDIDDLAVALTEACANAVRHAAGAEDYRLEIGLDDHCCTVVVADTGRGFVQTEPHMPSPESINGRGLAMMDALVDRTDIETSPGAGTVVRLVKTVRHVGLVGG